ncbi:MAG: hypothetical protein RIB58_02135 [Phycisphaerales bacterium]
MPLRSGEIRMTRFRFPCVDDRGVLVPSGWLMSKRKARLSGIDPSTSKAALRRVNRESGRYGARAGLIMGLPVVFLVGASEFMPWPIVIGAAVVLAELTNLIQWPNAWPLFTTALRDGWLARGRCPACGAVIAELEPQEDNCRVCPECGSAWKMDTDTLPPPR